MSNESRVEFVRWFRRNSKGDDKKLRVFMMKNNIDYAVYGRSNCEYIAQQFYKTKESIRSYGSDDQKSADRIECIYFRREIFTPIARDYVMRQQKTVEIYKRDDDKKWIIDQRITPSNLSVGSVGEASANIVSVIISIEKEIRTISVALCNLSSFTFEIAEFIDDAQYTKLSALFVAKGVKQCIFKCVKPSNAQQKEIIECKFNQILHKNGVQFVDTNAGENTKFWSFLKHETRTISTNINTLINTASSKRLFTFSTNYQYALHALYGIISYEGLQKNDKHFNRYKLIETKMDSFMRLDSSALNALNLFPSLKDALFGARAASNSNSDSNYNSLYGVLKKCKSAMGDRLLSIWIRQPLINLNMIQRRQKLIKLFVENNESRDILRDEHLKSLIDLEKLLAKLIKNKANLKDLVELYNFAEKIQWIKDALSNCNNEEDDDDEDEDIDIANDAINILKKEFIEPMNEMETNFNNYLAMIEQVVDLSAISKREYLINPQYDPLLDKYDAKKTKIMKQMNVFHEQIIGKLGESEKTIRLEKHKSHGWCLRILKKQSKKIKSKSKSKSEYQILSTQKNCTYFTDSNSELRKLSKSYTEYDKKYKERQKIIVNKTIEITKTYIPVIDLAINVFAELDVLLALAHVAAYSTTKYVQPKIYSSSDTNSKFIKIKNARHPCLELTQLDDDIGVIPNDVEMVFNESSFQVITGPNMGGKSTYIRMVGMIVLMAQIGSYVPADSCSLTIVDCILARVGAGDNQLRGVSTFMAEMLESAAILEAATPDSLIIIDELGRGTSTYDGYGIAYAISEHIIRKLQSFCLFATHFHELSILSLKHECAVNKHVSVHFDEEQDALTMLYKIIEGASPQSYGIQVAKLAKFPQNVIETAKDKAKQLESVSNSIISSHTYNSIEYIIERFQKYKKGTESIETLTKFIKEQMNQNKELREIASKFTKEQTNENKELMDVD